MSLGQRPLTIPSLAQAYVSLDLETTGLDADRDKIIQIGAVKFQGDQVVGTFDTFVNPGRGIPDFVQRLTGIRPEQVSRAPFFSSVSQDLETFLEGHPIIGHNISFDLRFLETHGLPLANPGYDTWDLASFLLPRNPEYNLVYLAKQFGIAHHNAHRAIDDADATRQLFLTLLRRAGELHPGLLDYVHSLAARSRWGVANLLAGVETEYDTGYYDTGYREAAGEDNGASVFGLSGLDLSSLAARLGNPERRRDDSNLKHLDENKIAGLMGPTGPFAKTFPGFERRPEQSQMLQSVAEAIYQGRHLIVEGGTGVGKSIAYLLPAALFAAAQGQRVVISTNTINLQEQLIRKDIPALIEVLEGAEVVDRGLVKATPLKGRANYLCLRRWRRLVQSDNLTSDEARVLSKTAVWLQDTVGGDRGELNLSGRDAFQWSKISAGDKNRCPAIRNAGEPCFLRSARERADQAHIVVVNHALLLSDLALGGGIIPDYQHLIIDEAHHLEDEATRQWEFQVPADRLDDTLEQQGRLTNELRIALRAGGLASPVSLEAEKVLADVEMCPPLLREHRARLWGVAERLLNVHRSDPSDDQMQLLLRPSAFKGPGQQAWADLGINWENLDSRLQQAIDALSRLQRFLESTPVPSANDQATMATEAATAQANLEQLREQMGSIINAGDDSKIHWIDQNHGRGEVTFHSAPLEIGATLAQQLFARKESVIMTSATLSTEGDFGYFKDRTGVPAESAEMVVGSPFDYQKAALLLIPEDMPLPTADGYIEALSRTLADLAKALDGRTMALFTSYSSLRAVSNQVRPRLTSQGIQVLAQGTDGSPQQLTARFSEEPRSLLLGTSSFWEGVDLPGGILKAVVLARLPFQVPTDPIVRSRSEQYQDPFKEYSIPQAVLRFRQGIGRLIRGKGDRGAIVVLDRRITGRSYGHSFLRSIPPCTLKPSTVSTVGTLAADWVGERREAKDRTAV
jgi:DNA polymerase-3 subunit epsilon/ATP-dependent DNA helicase DinG